MDVGRCGTSGEVQSVARQLLSKQVLYQGQASNDRTVCCHFSDFKKPPDRCGGRGGGSADVNIFALHKVEGLIQDYLRSHWGEKA